MRPYIGITDFTNFKQVLAMLSVFKEKQQLVRDRVLHVGVMMSYKTLHGIDTKWEDVFPQKEVISEIFASDQVLNCLHYADHEEDLDLCRSLTRAISFGGQGIHALQLDMTWPDPGKVSQAVHASSKRLEVILQVGKNAFDQINNDQDVLIDKLREYDGVIHRVILDKSMGRGLGMDADTLLPFARSIQQHMPSIGLVAAGGLGPKSMHLVEPMVAEFPNISIDAQGQLRPSGNALDPVDWGMSAEYLRNAIAMFSK